MNARFESGIEASSPERLVSCTCPDLDICLPVERGGNATCQPCSIRTDRLSRTIPARRIVWRAQDMQDVMPVICGGWAAAIVMLSNGSRQIVSFLLPGDFVSTALLFEAKPCCLVEAITDVQCQAFNRAELKAMLSRKPDLFERFSKAWGEEKTRANELIVDLGRRTANERIARLILNLADRLAERGLVRSNPTEFEFPLRQHHIADATGLTPVHVSKVLTEFRRSGLISINERSLTILDEPAFRRVAHMR